MIKIGGPFTRINYEPINLDSPDQVKKYLLEQGWKPTQWNYSKKTKERTSPKLTEDSFKSVVGEVPKLVARRNIIKHRRRTIKNYDDPTKGLINIARKNNGRIPATGIPQGTPTGRYTHSGGICNVPKAKDSVVLGHEMRSLFKADWPYVMIGADLDAIEARVQAHYCYKYPGGPAFAEELLNGDPHSINANAWDVDRDTAKTALYALMYGCGNAKLAATLGRSKGQGKKLRQVFWDANPALAALKDDVDKAVDRRGYLIGLDGRKLYVRSKHSALNLLFQSAAAIIFKYGIVILDQMLERYDAYQIIAYHDEVELLSHIDCVEEVCLACEEAFRIAGERLKIRVPITAEANVGLSWCEVH